MNFFGKKIKFPKVQTKGKEFDIRLNDHQLERIKKIYDKDFNLLKKKDENTKVQKL